MPLMLGFQYEPKNLSFSPRSYSLYIKPQFKAIVQDFQTLYKILSTEEKLGYAHKSILIDWYKISHELNAHCSTKLDQKYCQELRERLYQQIKKTLAHLEQLSRDNPFKNLKTIKNLAKLKLKTYRLEDLIIQIKLATSKHKASRSYTALAREVVSYRESFQELSLVFLPSIYRESFNLVEMNFLIPVINNFISDDKQNNLYTMTKDLNKNLHLFLMEMLKKGKPIPPKAKTLLEVMQRRWNSILKIMVKK